MIGATVLIYLFIRSYGDRLIVSPSSAAGILPKGAPEVHIDAMLHVLLALVVIIIAARGIGTLFRGIGQPPVVGEILSGIMLGPSLLGHISPAVSAYVLPSSVAPFLNVLSQVGVILSPWSITLLMDAPRWNSHPVLRDTANAPCTRSSCLASQAAWTTN